MHPTLIILIEESSRIYLRRSSFESRHRNSLHGRQFWVGCAGGVGVLLSAAVIRRAGGWGGVAEHSIMWASICETPLPPTRG